MRCLCSKWSVAIFACALIFMISCDSDKDTEIDGKWQLKEVMELDGSVHPVDTVWYNFQNTLFMYQLYDPENDTYPYTFGVKYKESENTIRLEMHAWPVAVDSFLPLTDWENGIRTFHVDKKNNKTLILSADGKEYHFKKF